MPPRAAAHQTVRRQRAAAALCHRVRDGRADDRGERRAPAPGRARSRSLPGSGATRRSHEEEFAVRRGLCRLPVRDARRLLRPSPDDRRPPSRVGGRARRASGSRAPRALFAGRGEAAGGRAATARGRAQSPRRRRRVHDLPAQRLRRRARRIGASRRRPGRPSRARPPRVRGAAPRRGLRPAVRYRPSRSRRSRARRARRPRPTPRASEGAAPTPPRPQPDPALRERARGRWRAPLRDAFPAARRPPGQRRCTARRLRSLPAGVRAQPAG